MSARQPTVDEFLADLDHPRVDDIRRIREGLLAGDAELGERIKWNAPSFGHNGDDRVTFRLQPGNRFELVFRRGVHKRNDPFTFDDPDHLIAWATNDRGTTVVTLWITDHEVTRLLALAHRWLQATRSPKQPAPDAGVPLVRPRSSKPRRPRIVAMS
jgi:hypothetical protein